MIFLLVQASSDSSALTTVEFIISAARKSKTDATALKTALTRHTDLLPALADAIAQGISTEASRVVGSAVLP
jgi:hypothetical protein